MAIAIERKNLFFIIFFLNLAVITFFGLNFLFRKK